MTPTEFVTGLLVGFLAVVASLHAVLRRRNPNAALWWIGVVWTVPILGPALYYFFGINRIERKAARLRRHAQIEKKAQFPALSRAEKEKSFQVEFGNLGSLAQLVERVIHLPLLSGNRITPLINGDEAYPAMLNAIEKAEKSIGLSTYIFENDPSGGFFIDALARAAARGVEVRVLIDDVGSGVKWRSVFNELRAHKVSVAYFLPTFVPWRMAYMNLRNHRKILTIDGHLAFSGGMNISQNHVLKTNPQHPAQDIHFQIEGPVVSQIQDAFRLDWHFTAGEELSGAAWFPELTSIGTVFARGIADGPDEDFEKCKWTLLGALAHARKSVRIVTPYLIPDASLLAGINLAAFSGVRVDILLPQKNDMALVHWATQAMLWQVLERGCRVWRTPPPFDHTKLLIVDDGWTLFGSTNWDHRSLRLNFEFNMECYDKALAEKMSRLVDEKISTASSVTLQDVDSRPLPIKLRDGVARLFSPLL